MAQFLNELQENLTNDYSPFVIGITDRYHKNIYYQLYSNF